MSPRALTPYLAPLLALLIVLISPNARLARAGGVAPPAPPVVDTPPPPPFPVTVYAEDDRPAPEPAHLVARPVYQQVAQPAQLAGDPYGFTAWLNGVRAQSGLGAVGHDPSLSGWAATNNGQQQARGMGHHVMGPARRQNSGMGDFSSVTSMWMASPAHRAALLDPSISWIGIASLGAYWTYNAY